MRLPIVTCLTVIFVGCSSPAGDGDGDAADADAPDTVVSSVDSGAVDDTAPVSTFTQARFRVTRLELLGTTFGLDLDGDGQPDNALPPVLASMDALLPDDFSIPGVNQRIADLIATGASLVLLDAVHDQQVLSVGMLLGEEALDGTLSVDPSSYDALGQAREKLEGAFDDQTTFRVGPGNLSLPVPLDEDLAPLVFKLEHTHMDGDLTGLATSGMIGGVFSLGTIRDDIALPLIQDNVSDPAARELYLTTISALLPGAADYDDGTLQGISAAFFFEAEPADW